MDKVKIVLDRKGVMQMLKSKEAENICREFADKAAKRLGDGYEVSTYAGKKRVNASIKAVTYKARKETKQDNAILKAVLDVPVFMEEPAKPPQKYIIIDKLGSSEKNRLSSVTLAVQSYGGSLYEAARLNHTVKAAMRDAVTLDDVISCKLNSDYNYTDEETKRYRYQAVFDIRFYD